jgi:hypothetical protein
MTLPDFGGVQSGETYYYLPLNYNTLECVNPSEEASNCLYAHLYHEGKCKKGGNNMASLIVKQLKHLGLFNQLKGIGD